MPISVSVVIPAFNAAAFIEATLESVFSQTHLPDEVIVVDDGSTDHTVKVLAKYPVKVIRQANGGPARARNTGILASQGDWVAFLDHDDRWHPRKTEIQLGMIEGAVSAVFSVKVPTDREITFEDMFWRNYGGSPSSSIVRRETLVSLGMFDDDPRMKGVDDYNFWLKFLFAGHQFRISPNLYDFTPAENHYSGNEDKMLNAELYNIDTVGAMAGLSAGTIERRKKNVRLEYLPGLIYQRRLVAARTHLRKLGLDIRALPYAYAFLPVWIIDLKRKFRGRHFAG